MLPSRSALREAGPTRGGRRRVIRRALAAICLQLGVLVAVAPTAAGGDHVARLELSGVVDQMNAAFVDEGLRYAGDSGAAAAIIAIDSPGGDLASMDAIIKSILGSPVPVITYVTPAGARAGSAATFITLAGDVAAMTPSTNIGAASVISGSGEDLPSTLERKVTNDAVARIRDLADRQARNADWAESAVRQAASISAADAVAMQPPVVDLLAANEAALLDAIDAGERADGHPYRFHGEPLPPLAGLPIRDVTMNIGQQFLHALSDPNIAFILFTIGFYGIVAELVHPNFFSGIAGGIAIVLAFIGSSSLPLNLGGLLLILGGLGLLALELTVASYGLLTIGGIVCLVLGAFALYTSPAPGDSIQVSVSPWIIAAIVALSLVFFLFVAREAVATYRRRSTGEPIMGLVGTRGTAQTLIAPTGIAYAGGESWSARSAHDITPGSPVRVTGIDGLELIVEPLAADSAVAPEEDPSHE
jgi:membrane-bound serine protease (ClpP class)